MGETTAESGFNDDRSKLPFARGGPIFVYDLVGPVTTTFDFKAAVLDELNGLEAELGSIGDFEDELSTKELKVFTEEELVEKALKEEFEDFPGIAESSQVLEHADEEMRKDSCITGEEVICSGNSAIVCSISGSCVSLDEPSTVTCNTIVPEEKTQKKKKKKRGRSFDRNSRSGELEGSYFAKVNQLAKIKQKQDETKLDARLHSFSGESRINEGTITTSDKIERLNSLRSITNPAKAKSLDSQEGMPVCYPEVVLCIEVYHNKKLQKNQEFLVLGNQRLTDLRDNIYCLTDRLMKISGEHDPSGYFFIENTFCNDLRDPLAIDYSKPIFDWLKNSKNEAAEKWEFITSAELKKQKDLLRGVEISNMPNLKAVDMHRTRFCDLQFRLGAGYLYCHQGNCKHSLVIRDMRLIHPEDAQKQAAYPLLTFKLQFRPRKCSVCLIYLAEKMTVDDKWASKNPCYFCKDCYFLQHYKEDGSLMYPHLVFDYHHE